MEIYGNATSFNLETVLKQNITACDYYRNDCTKLPDWQSVIDEIYNAVDNVEPWIGGNARGPSTAFCLLHRLFTLRMSVEEITATLNHTDSPYIRAVGLLYLRYVCDPRNLWNWFQGYVDDKESFKPSKFQGEVTIGDFARDLLLEQFYFETLFPRIPKKVQDDITAALQARGLPTQPKGNGGAGGPDRRGGDDGNRRPASVKASLSVALGQKAPNRAGTKDYSVREAMWEEKMGGRDRGGDRGGERGERGGERDRGSGREPDRERDRGYGGDRDRGRGYENGSGRDRDRGGERDRGGYGGGSRGGGDWDRDRGGSRGGDWERERGEYPRGGGGGGGGGARSPYRGGSSRDRSPYRGGDGGGGRDRRRSRSRSRGRDRSPYRGGDGGRYERRSSRSRSRDRRRSRSPPRGGGGGGGRDARDVFRESAAEFGGGGGGGGGVGATGSGDVRSRYGDASGSRLFDDGKYRGGGGRTGEEVYRLGARKGGGGGGYR